MDDYAGYEVRGLLGEHGLSIFLEVDGGRRKRFSMLFDVGQTGDTLLHNASLMGIDLAEISLIAFSHRHYDHTGGLVRVLKHWARRIPVIAHPDLFIPQVYIGRGRVSLMLGPPYSRREAEDAGATFIFTREALPLFPGVYFLGEIPRETEFEPVPREFVSLRDGRAERDGVVDDTAVAVVVEGRGVLVLTGCSHSGIVNIVRRAAEVAGSKVFSVIGGFHLIGAERRRIKATVRELVRMGVEEVHVGHCTGLDAEYMLKEAFKDGFGKIHSGYTIEY